MSLRRPYRIIVCPQCQRRRGGNRDRENYDYYRWTCSQQHTWLVKVPHFDQVTEIAKETIAGSISNLFQRDNPFYMALRRR